MRILGIDPGLGRIGLGLVEREGSGPVSVIEWVTLETPPNTEIGPRLIEIHHDLREYLEETKPDLAVVERLFFANNHQTAFDVAHARGVILLSLSEHAVPFLEPSPSNLKATLTGHGNASKTQVLTMLKQELKLQNPPKSDDAADALALAYFGALIGQQSPLLHGLHQN